MAREVLRLHHPSQLADLSVWPWRRMRGISGYEITDEKIPSDLRKQWQQELRRQVIACGCDLASLGMLLGVIGYGLWVGIGSAQPLGVATAIGVVSAAAAGLIAGKFVGLARASGKLKQTIAKIQNEWPAKPIPKPEHGGLCG